MRTIYFIAGLTVILAACNSKTTSSDFIPGTYVNQAQSNYSVANDTLVIEAAKNTENIYLITRKTAYRRISDGKVGEPQYLRRQLTGTWDPVKQTLQVMQNETVIIFQPEQHKLLIGTNAYWKL